MSVFRVYEYIYYVALYARVCGSAISMDYRWIRTISMDYLYGYMSGVQWSCDS